MHADQVKIVDRIIAEMEKGVLPWRCQFEASKSKTGLPYNAISGASYRGFNVIALLMTGRPVEGGWLTYKQAIAAGGHVRKGERSTVIFYYKKLAKKDARADKPAYWLMAKSYLVFHLSQCDNINAAKLHQFPNADAASIDHKARSAEADAFISAVPANVTYSAATSTPCYISALDVVRMPLFEQYKSADAFYSTAIHELAHWTGPRLKRDLTGRMVANYALEELVAELTACFTLPQFGMNNEQNNARYLAGWISALKEKPQILTSVASEAAKVNAFLNAFSNAADAGEPDAGEPEEISEAA
jgi:antirestriction protein ArdC